MARLAIYWEGEGCGLRLTQLMSFNKSHFCVHIVFLYVEFTFNPEGAVHLNPKKPRNRGQETMPWKEIMAIANATVFIKGE